MQMLITGLMHTAFAKYGLYCKLKASFLGTPPPPRGPSQESLAHVPD